MTDQTMLGAMLLGERKIEIQEMPVPKPGPGEILVKIKAATTCGTDLKIYRQGHPKFPPPFVFGHEFGGDIVEVGSGVKRFRPGMRVTANVFGECGDCFFCVRGQGNLCENLKYNMGAFAEYHLIPASIVKQNTFVIPDHVEYSEAAVVEPLVCVVHAFEKIAFKEGETAAVIGAGGPISLLFIQMLRNAGADQIIAIGHSDIRLKAARAAGATSLVNAKKVDALKEVEYLTREVGPDLVIESAGTKTAWESGIEMVRRGGRVLWFGGLPGGTMVLVDAKKVHYGGIDLINSHGGTAKDAEKAFQLITAGEINTLSLISEEMPLVNVEDAILKMMAGETIKVALIP